jgi:RNA recognition motif-containing protein
MGKKLYVGNFSFSTTEDSLSAKFGECGTVESVRIITDRDTGRSKGFGFIEMATDEEAQAAIEKFNEIEFEGRPLKVNEARPMQPRGNGGGGGGFGSRGGNGGNRSRGGFGGGGNRNR